MDQRTCRVCRVVLDPETNWLPSHHYKQNVCKTCHSKHVLPYVKAWQARNPDKVKAAGDRHRSKPENRERDRAKSRAYYYANRERVLAAQNAKRAAARRLKLIAVLNTAMPNEACRRCDARLVVGANWFVSFAQRNNRLCKPCHRVSQTPATMAWAAANPERAKEIRLAYIERHRDRIKARRDAYYAENAEKLKAASKANYAANRETILAQLRAKRRAKGGRDE